MFTAVIERLSGKAALQEEIKVLKSALDQSRHDAAECEKAQDVLSMLYSERGDELSQIEQEKATLQAERDEWKRQNTDLEVRLDTLFIAFQKADVDREVWQDELRHEREHREQTALRNQQLQVELDSVQDVVERLQGQLQDASALIERYAEIPLVALASKSMALLAELYEARQKHGSVKAWDTRYLDLKAQHGQIAPVEAVEAKEE